MNLPDRLIHYGLIFLIFFTPLAFGTVHVWAYTVMELTVFLLLLIWLTKTLVRSPSSPVTSHQLLVTSSQSSTDLDSRLETNDSRLGSNDSRLETKDSRLISNDSRLVFSHTPLNLPLLFFLGLILLQLVPLPPSALKLISPNTYTIYKQTVPGYDTQGQSPVMSHQSPVTSHQSSTDLDSRLQTPDSRLITNDSRLQTDDSRLINNESQLATPIPHSTDSSIPNPNSQFQNPSSLDSRLQTPDSRLITNDSQPATRNPQRVTNLSDSTNAVSPIPKSKIQNPSSPDSRLSTSDWRPVSIYPHATKAEFFKYLAYLGVFFLIINTVKTRSQIRQLVIAIILAGTCIALLGIMQMATGTDKIYWFWQSHYKRGDYFGPYVNPNHFAGYMEMVTALAIGLLLSRRSPAGNHQAKSWRYRLSAFDAWFSKNALLVFVIVLMVAALCFSLSRGGILTFLFSVILFLNLLFFTHRKRKRSVNLLLSVFSISLLFLVWLGIDPVLKELATLSDLDKASPGRPIVWGDTVRLAKDYPLFGVGLGNFPNLYPKYRTIESKRFYLHAENDYLETLADTGGIGFLFLFGGIIFFLIMMTRKWLERREPFVRGIALGGIVGAAAILFHSLADFNLHIPANALLLFVILGLTAVTVHVKIRKNEESSLLPVRTYTIKSKMKMVLYPVALVLLLGLSTAVVKTCIASFHYQNYKESLVASRQSNPAIQNPKSKILTPPDSRLPTQDSNPAIQNPNSKIQNPDASGLQTPDSGLESRNPKSKIQNPKSKDSRLPTLDYLLSALSLDPSNALYHHELGQYYSLRMTELWKESKWKLHSGTWYVDFKRETIDYGLLTLDSFFQAVILRPTDGWHQAQLGWILQQLLQLHTIAHPDPPFATRDFANFVTSRLVTQDYRLTTCAPTHYFSLALSLDPTNPFIKKYVEKTTGLEPPVSRP